MTEKTRLQEEACGHSLEYLQQKWYSKLLQIRFTNLLLQVQSGGRNRQAAVEPSLFREPKSEVSNLTSPVKVVGQVGVLDRRNRTRTRTKNPEERPFTIICWLSRIVTQVATLRPMLPHHKPWVTQCSCTCPLHDHLFKLGRPVEASITAPILTTRSTCSGRQLYKKTSALTQITTGAPARSSRARAVPSSDYCPGAPGCHVSERRSTRTWCRPRRRSRRGRAHCAGRSASDGTCS